jgi:diguanylate cyclase (GGDEF)-like protein
VNQERGLALSILSALDIAILRRVGDRRYEMYGRMPDFYQRLFPGEEGRPNVEPWKLSGMLEFFLDDAEAFFARDCGFGATTVLSSGIWQEEGLQTGKLALIASAMCVEHEQILIIRLLSDDFIDRRRILQKAREHLLERRMLHTDLETYRHKANFDSLTGLYNRAAFMQALQEETDRVTREGGDLSLLIMDIDDFKGINDMYGHLAGDSVLASLGQLLRQLLRRDDMPARYGGEEFVVLAPFTSEQQALRMAEKLRCGIAEHSFGALPMVTVSIGCTAYHAGELLDSLIQRVDLALYDAKKNGKNLVCYR